MTGVMRWSLGAFLLMAGCYAQSGTEPVEPADGPLQCVVGTYPQVEAELDGAVMLSLGYPRFSPDYEWNLYLDTFEVARTPALDAAVERGEGTFAVGPHEDLLMIARAPEATRYELLPAETAFERCPPVLPAP
jgi:hypothetical protein